MFFHTEKTTTKELNQFCTQKPILYSANIQDFLGFKTVMRHLFVILVRLPGQFRMKPFSDHALLTSTVRTTLDTTYKTKSDRGVY